MNTLKIAICDDEQCMTKKVHNYLKLYFSKQHIAVHYTFFTDGVYLLNSDEIFDIIILDIEMNIINGIEVKEQICKKRIHSKIIFLTSHRDMAIDSVGRNVYGFVPKDEMDRLERHLNTIMNEYKAHQLITITGENIDIYHIAYIHSSAGYCYFYDIEGNEKVFRILLNKAEDMLPQKKNFMRIHQSYIVNFDYVQKCSYGQVELKKEKGGLLYLPVSRKYTNEVFESYVRYKKERCRYG